MKVGVFAFLISFNWASAERTIRVRNSCDKAGWVIVTDGFGSTHPDLSSYRVDANNGTADFVWSEVPPDGSDVVWSGNLALCLNGTCASTLSEDECDAGKCTIADGGPLSRAEFTLLTSVDYYDLSIINGVNVPMSITPMMLGESSSSLRSPPKESDDDDPYWCGNPGGAVPLSQGAPGSSWKFDPPFAPYYTWVLSGGESCETDEDCSAVEGEVCGLSNNIGSSPQYSLSCGAPGLGYWTADQVCGGDLSMAFPFNCSQPMTQGPNPGTDTLWTYLGCTDGISSCYSSGAPSSCCGCFDWWSDWGLPVASTTTPCQNANSEWQQTAGSTLVFLKTGCPTCYTYPYDDVSSTFLCSSTTTTTSSSSAALNSSRSTDIAATSTDSTIRIATDEASTVAAASASATRTTTRHLSRRPAAATKRSGHGGGVGGSDVADSNSVDYEVEFCPA